MAAPGEEDSTPLRSDPQAPAHPLVDTPDRLALCAATLAAGSGPFALDAERAGGFRYSQRAYLVQIHREGAGTWLIDPVALPADQLSSQLAPVLGTDEWVLHAANQDLPCLDELGLRGPRLFDTELAGRLLGDERVGLSTMTERYLGFALAKEHGAADWSRRPLPDDWLRYAALDVDVLLPLREVLAHALAEAGKQGWADQEFEFVRAAPPPAPRTDPWRRIKGLASRRPQDLAVARELWEARDAIARKTDRAPGKVLPDHALAALASARPTSATDVKRLIGRRRGADRAATWVDAIARATALPSSAWPTRHSGTSGVPHHRNWERLNPPAAKRYRAAVAALDELAGELLLPRENLIGGRALRSTVWALTPEGAEPPRPCDEAEMATTLLSAGVRPWQAELAAGPLSAALASADRTPSEPLTTGE